MSEPLGILRIGDRDVVIDETTAVRDLLAVIRLLGGMERMRRERKPWQCAYPGCTSDTPHGHTQAMS